MVDNIVDYFDVEDKYHVFVWRQLMETGKWPEEFWEEIKDLEFPPNWAIKITTKLAEAYCSYYQ